MLFSGEENADCRLQNPFLKLFPPVSSILFVRENRLVEFKVELALLLVGEEVALEFLAVEVLLSPLGRKVAATTP